MRHLLTAVFGMALAGTAIAADQAPTVTSSTDPALGNASSELETVNTICPVCGAGVDLQREPVSIYDPQNRTWMGVGVDSDAHAALIQQQPERYAAAARANSRLSDSRGTTSGMEEGKDASAEVDDPLERQDRAGAFEFNSPAEGGMSDEASAMNVGKEAAPESADSTYERQGRASALEFNRDEAAEQTDGGWRGSSSGMESDDAAETEGKAADRRELGNGRASALEFNDQERNRADGETDAYESHDHHH